MEFIKEMDYKQEFGLETYRMGICFTKLCTGNSHLALRNGEIQIGVAFFVNLVLRKGVINTKTRRVDSHNKTNNCVLTEAVWWAHYTFASPNEAKLIIGDLFPIKDLKKEQNYGSLHIIKTSSFQAY